MDCLPLSPAYFFVLFTFHNIYCLNVVVSSCLSVPLSLSLPIKFTLPLSLSTFFSGVVDHGIFAGFTTAVIVAGKDGVRVAGAGGEKPWW